MENLDFHSDEAFQIRFRIEGYNRNPTKMTAIIDDVLLLDGLCSSQTTPGPATTPKPPGNLLSAILNFFFFFTNLLFSNEMQ